MARFTVRQPLQPTQTAHQLASAGEVMVVFVYPVVYYVVDASAEIWITPDRSLRQWQKNHHNISQNYMSQKL